MTDWIFNRDTIRTFRFVRCAFDAQTGVAQLVYAFDDGPELTETVTVPGAPFALDAARAEAARQAAASLLGSELAHIDHALLHAELARAAAQWTHEARKLSGR